ncbi:MAG: histidine kinase dimerization/phosphoacceptor domain -containing protein [Methanoregula sp.]|jgi:two-component sensor histidine kinase/CheY-like chemotaxis protein
MARILIADDIPANLYLLESILKGYGFEVISVKNGAEALAAAQGDPPDLIITDIMMPVMDGFELCRQVKADGNLNPVPIVFYTSTYTEEKDEQLAMNLGVEQFVIKPQKPEEIIRIVRKILDKTPAMTSLPAHKPLGDEMEILREYNEVLFHKLEKKVIQLEEEIAERKRAEERLLRFNEKLENGVAERTAQLNKSLHEKELLLKEIHHRVKNNLQIVASLLNIQSRQITDPAVLAMIAESQNRVKAMALVHEKLYRSDDISSIDIADYVKFMGTGLIKFYGITSSQVRLEVDMPGIRFDINRAIPLGLIINELLSNALKHAFPAGRIGKITVTGDRNGKAIRILVRDDGAGIPASFDWKNTESLGLHLVNSLTDQISGTIELDRSSGTKFIITVPEQGPV